MGRYRDREPNLIDEIQRLTQRVAKLESSNRISYTAVDSSGLRIVNGNLELANSSGNVPIELGKVPGVNRFTLRFRNDNGDVGAEFGQLTDNRIGGEITLDGALVTVLDSPGIVVLFDHVPAINESDLFQVIQTHPTAGQLMTMWINERGMLRLEQQQGSRFDNLYLAIMDGAADPNTSGWPFSVERRDSGVRTRIGGINAFGQYSTELFEWEPITDVDPDATGNYTTTGTDAGAAELSVRQETSDIVRLQGRVLATDMVADEVIMNIPSPYFPLAKRLRAIAVDDGSSISCDFLPDSSVVTKASISGTVELSFDDITYSRFFVEQPTGDWTIETAGIATPDTSSPISVSHTSEADTGYVLFVSREAANDTIDTPTDDGSNTWVAGPTAGGGGVGRRISIFTLVPASPFTEISISFSGGSVCYATLIKVTGHDPADFVDVSAAEVRSSSTTPAALEVTPSAADSIMIAAVQANPNTIGGITPSAGFTDLSTDNGGPDVVYMVNPPTSATGVSWTFGSGAGSGHAIIVLNPEP